MGTLFVVATPIGNLSDITERSKEVLRTVDQILCEDTRVTRKLLTFFEIKTPTRSYHQHSSEKDTEEILSLLIDGQNLALVTDAGTPGISDPGGRLVEHCHQQGITVSPIPGPSAIIAALSIAGFPAEKFTFLGFPPHKKKRQKYLDNLVSIDHTTVLYESNHRIEKLLGELSEKLDPEQQLCVCRELTKKFESVYRGTISQILSMNIPTKGEFVVVIGPFKNN